jgi:hypothetical protein
VGFFNRHFAIIPLMIVAGEMENSVQGQDLHFVTRSMSKAARIGSSDFGRDRNISCKSVARFTERRKRQHIGWLVLSAKVFIQTAQVAIARHQDIDGA